MNPIDLAADVLQRNLDMLQTTLADFSDADLLVRPCPKANHTAWQLGHLIASETRMISACKPGAMPALPEGFDKKFTKETAASDDPALFPNKQRLLNQLAKTRAATVAWIRTLSPADLDKPGPEPMRQYVPTVGHLVFMIPNHVAMHLGQMQVMRRKLGKPLLH
ncbi:MAG: DinB family protein [Tepidisphaeraceae bacterium]|jgi:uncharacterized damage-inducible protein DinB